MHVSTPLAGLDVGLVVPLAALLEERSVLAASRRLGLSPSATSHALSRLRATLGDAILVRAGRRLVLTQLGESLLEPARRALANLQTIFVRTRTLSPRSLRAAFRIATSDHVQMVLFGRLDRLLAREAPLVDVYVLPADRGSIESLREGLADATISVFFEPRPADVGEIDLWTDQLVTVVRAGHPLCSGRVTAKRYVAHPHVLVTPYVTSPRGPVDDALAERGLSRRVARTFPTFVDAAHFVAASDYVVALPGTLVKRMSAGLRLRVIRAPVPMLRYTIRMLWHRRFDDDPAHAWFRGAIQRSAAKIDGLS